MTGSGDGWVARGYVAVDGGHGASVFAALPRVTPRLQPVASPRHADLLIAVEPITRKLVPALMETVRALPAPRAALVVGEPAGRRFPEAEFVRLEELLPGIRRVDNAGNTDAIVHAALTARPLEQLTLERASVEPVTVPIPPKHERDIATEPVVVTLGPLQALSAGPLRLLLVCDGEQVVSAEVESGYAARQVAGAMTRASWSAAADLAAALDPLAPVAGRVAYVTALERIQGGQVAPDADRARQAALALERATNAILWLERFAGVLAYDRLFGRVAALGAELDDVARATREQPPQSWIVPHGGTGPLNRGAWNRLAGLAAATRALERQLTRDRALALRTGGVGTIGADRLRAAGVTGPVLRASVEGRGDSFSRLLVRAELAAADLATAAELLTDVSGAPEPRFRWDVPKGEAVAAVEGPRGTLAVSVTSDGGGNPRAVEWRRPSTNVLTMLPHLLADQTVADAEIIVASLDLAMAEIDG